MLSVVAPLAMLAGCGPQIDAPTTLNGDSFVAIERPLSAKAAALRSTQSVPNDKNQSFYIAINKRELGQKWFLTAYLKDYYPGTVGAGAASSLGVKVVTFRVQNDKLFVFDASDNFATSDTFDPELIVEAYPLVNSSSFNVLTGSGNYVLFDPAAGLNRFGVLSDAFAGGSQPAHVEVDLAFMQNFRKIGDGATFEQVFTGYSNDVALSNSGNVFQASGTLGLSLRRYAESPEYTPTDLVVNPATGAVTDYYFRSDAHIIKNAGGSYQTAAKWNIHKGMKPITWLISEQFVNLKNDPRFAAYDVAGAVQKGVENWNAAFGFKALQAKIATAADSYADDDKNYIIFDADPTYGYAFANWRMNPNTGETRGASIYFSGSWLDLVDYFTDDALPTGTVPPNAPAGVVPGPMKTLTWGNMHSDPLCVLWVPTKATSLDDLIGSSGAAPLATKKEKFEAFIAHLINHEVGHTLGLRHNFKGSLAPPSSSVMDYYDYNDSTLQPGPQPYDVAAVQYLYGLSTALPTQAFCTDENTLTDPDCGRYDHSADPLNQDAGPTYVSVLTAFLKGQSATPPNSTLNRVIKWLKGPNTAQRAQAWKYLLTGLNVGVDAAGNGYVPARIDVAAGRLFARMYLDPATSRGQPNDPGAFLQDPPLDAAVTPLLVTELKGNLVNSDGIRSYATRRQTVAVLKKLQITIALTALTDARKTIAAARVNLTGTDATLTDELLSRIDTAVANYFN